MGVGRCLYILLSLFFSYFFGFLFSFFFFLFLTDGIMFKGSKRFSNWVLAEDKLRAIVHNDIFKSWRTLIGQSSAKETSSTINASATVKEGLSRVPSSAASTSLFPGYDSQLFQLPQCHKILKRNNFVIVYDQAKRIPLYVAETLTKESLEGETKRSSKFYEELSIPSLFRSSKSDYKGSGFDRGHMAPAGNNKGSRLSMKQTFTLANIVPQERNNNQGIWNELEKYCRHLTSSWNAVHVITGHVMKPEKTRDLHGNVTKIVTYQVIGENEVAVPTHLFKVILCQRRRDDGGTKEHREKKAEQEKGGGIKGDLSLTSLGSKKEQMPSPPPPPNYPYPYNRDDPIATQMTLKLESYLIPNLDVGADKTFQYFRTPLREIEQYSGIEMFKEWRKWIEEGRQARQRGS